MSTVDLTAELHTVGEATRTALIDLANKIEGGTENGWVPTLYVAYLRTAAYMVGEVEDDVAKRGLYREADELIDVDELVTA